MAARRFAASVVVTFTVSCAPASPPETPGGGSSTHLERQADGTCLLSEEIECPPDTLCNPPPPRRVDCDTREPIADEPRPPPAPAGQPPVTEEPVSETPTTDPEPRPDTLPSATPGARIERRADGSCLEHLDPKCPPMTKCNPPAPRVVECP